MTRETLEKWRAALKKYRYAAAVVALGTVLMLLPKERESAPPSEETALGERFDRAAMQEEMEDILRSIDGVGELKLMLTVGSGTRQELAQNSTSERRGADSWQKTTETVVVGTGGGTKEVVVTNSYYPQYVGALVVCEGAGSAGVRLAVTNAVSALTALSSERISVVQGSP